jgi:hypothetical protein
VIRSRDPLFSASAQKVPAKRPFFILLNKLKKKKEKRKNIFFEGEREKIKK